MTRLEEAQQRLEAARNERQLNWTIYANQRVVRLESYRAQLLGIQAALDGDSIEDCPFRREYPLAQHWRDAWEYTAKGMVVGYNNERKPK